MGTSPAGPPAPQPSSAPSAQRRTDWALPALLALALGLAAAFLVARRFQEGPQEFGSDETPAAHGERWTPAEQPTGQTVSLAIDFGNGAVRQFDALPWTAAMTVGDLMRAAAAFRPAVWYQEEGAGGKAMLTALEGVAGEGPAGRYWFYEVDGRRGEVSFEIAPLQPGQRVLWLFAHGE